MNTCLTLCRALLLGAALAGCAATPPETTDENSTDTWSRIRSTLNQAATPAAQEAETPPSVRNALLPPVSLPRAPRPQAPAESRFDLAVNAVEARPFFTGLVKGTSRNIVVHDEVTGRISLDLRNVTVDEVLDVVREVYGYEYQQTRAGYVVLPARLRSRVFEVNYLNVRRRGDSNTRVNSGQVSDKSNGSLSIIDDTASDPPPDTTSQRSPGSQITTSSETDFWSGLEQTLRTIVGDGEGRSVVVNPAAGLAVVRAMPGELRDVEAFLQAAERSMQRQVILEAKIVEVTLNQAHQSGINWLGLNASGDPALFAGQATLVNGASPLLDDGGVFDPNSLAGAGDPDLFNFGGLFAIGAVADDFAALIRLLDTQGEAQVLSSPRVSTLNNQKAVIKVGTDEFFVTEVESSTLASGAGTTTTPSITLTPFFSGIALDVTPQINDRDEVILHIHPTVSEVRDQTKVITVAGETQSLPLAFSSVRESDSIVRARNGQVVVIGGLMQDKNDDSRGETPFLADLPVIGGLFRQKQKVAQRSELVILLRPMVVDSDRVWSEAIDSVNRRFDGLKPDSSR